MAIANKFLYFSTVAAYNTAKTAGNIATGSIVFVDQPYVAAHDEVAEIPAQRFIETHDKQFHANQAFNSIKAAIEALDVTDLTNSDASTRGVTITLNEADGKVTSIAISDLGGAKLGTYTKGSNDEAIAAGDTIAAALAKLENQIANKIGALDSDVSAGADKYFTGIELKDGKLVGTSEANSKTTVANVDSAKIVDYVAVSGDSAQTLATTDTIAQAIAKVQKNVEVEAAARAAAIQGLDYTIPNGEHTAGKAVTAVSETDGVIAVTEGNIKSDYVDYTPQVVTPASGDDPAVYDTAQTTVQGAIAEIYDKIADNQEAGEVALYENGVKVNEFKADGKTYTFKQGSTTIFTANLAKDMVVDGGSVVTVVFKSADNTLHEGTESGTDVTTAIMGSGTPTAANAGKYIKLTIANSTDILYIPVKDLYDDYTFNDGDEIDFTETNNEVTAVIKTGSIAKTKLTTALQNEITSARTTITEIAQTTPTATKHILVTKTDGSGATPDNYVISESDIASDSDLTAEVTRAKGAETAIDGAIGLTKGVSDETRTYTNTGEYIGKQSTNTVKSDIKALDTQAKANADAIGVLNGGDSVSGSVAKSIKDAIAGLDAEIESTSGTFATVTVTEADGKITGVTVAEGDADDIALSSGYTKATGTISAIAGGDSIETAIEKIDGKLDNLNSASPFEYANDTNKATKLKDSGLSAQHASEVAVGKYNVSHTGNDDSAKTQFSVGIGASAGATANGLEVRVNGDIYINLSLPTGTNGALENNYILLQDLLENEINWYEG